MPVLAVRSRPSRRLGSSEVAAEATGRGWRVLLAAPAEAERDHGYAALTDLLGPLFDAGGHALPEPLREAIAVALRRDRAQGPPDAVAVGAATRSLLEDGATAEPQRTLVLIPVARSRVLGFARRVSPSCSKAASTDR